MKHILIFILCLATSSAWALTPEAELIEKMKSQGYRLVEREKTWLGRVALEFESKTHEREIIINPNNGIVIRDYSERLDSDKDDDALDRFYGLFKSERD